MARRRRPPRAGALAELQPLRTAAQIATLQALFYAIALVLILFTALVAGMPFNMDLVLGWEFVRGDTTQGWLLAFIWLFTGGFCMAVAIVVLIARSKLVPDFALTVQFLHLLVTSFYTRTLPGNSMWWLALFGSSAMSISLAMWGCQYRELQPVFFGGRILNTGNSSAATGQTADPEAAEGVDDEDDEDDFSRGKSRGRGKDGQGTYEMVQMGSSSAS